ncbi:uncharacterized protein LOC116169700 isoform X2 [Photinus pyralis]|uniref:Ig-like domain-containing protein n=1 Tax=Photinus pyralis TaxID=7054 RepID=A0A1Y1LKS3_PHOPY|nr:uncharacterized protein LOC116169554 isoform X2 [Photinus pyralis]XP_031341537.1 uncharacterized protein LOC116169560 isoform X2 [Photinus pyralis]XP_031341712.1 uncharacterized protein LOC116169700 isoform X2 [Photinus pyralis]
MLANMIILLEIVVLTVVVEGSHLKMSSFSYSGESVTFECNVDHGEFPIVSITWLKDGKQFYKYDSNLINPVSITDVDGVVVKKDLSLNGNKVTIGSVTPQSTGTYTCKVEIDHPSLSVGELSGSLKIVQN